jgi:hypothetical protein
MPVFLPPEESYRAVLDDLALLTQDQGNFDVFQDADGAFRAAYQPLGADAVGTLIHQLVNETPDLEIVVFGVDPLFPTSSGRLMRRFGGLTVPRAVRPDGRQAVGGITVYYDVTECDGAGYVVYTEGGSMLPLPRQVMLYHELSHCWHLATSTHDPANPEAGPIEDENWLRFKLGLVSRPLDARAGGCR